jgi:hypothetical protein
MSVFAPVSLRSARLYFATRVVLVILSCQCYSVQVQLELLPGVISGLKVALKVAGAAQFQVELLLEE